MSVVLNNERQIRQLLCCGCSVLYILHSGVGIGTSDGKVQPRVWATELSCSWEAILTAQMRVHHILACSTLCPIA